MRAAGRFGAGAALWLLLGAEAVAAFEPITVVFAVGAASIYIAYQYPALYCRFAECCGEEKPLNASGTAGRWRGARDARDRTQWASAPGTRLARGRGRERGQLGPPCGFQPWKPRLLSR